MTIYRSLHMVPRDGGQKSGKVKEVGKAQQNPFEITGVICFTYVHT